MKLPSPSSALLSLLPIASLVTASNESVASAFKQCKLNWQQTSTGVSLVSHTFTSPAESNAASHSQPVTLDTTVKLNCAFEPNLPIHYAALIFQSQYTLPIRIRQVRGDTNLKLDLDLSRASADLLSLNGKIDYGLYVASYASTEQFVVPLGEFEFASSVGQSIKEERNNVVYPSEWEVERYATREIKIWTERKPKEGVSLIWGLLGSVVTFGVPLVVLGALLSQVLPHVPIKSSAYTNQTSLFFLLLVSMEGLILAYWVRVKLFTILPWLAGVGLVTIYVGRGALRERLAKRIS